MSVKELTEAFNNHFGLHKSRSEIHSTIKNNRLTCGRSTGEIQKGKSLLFTADQVQFIKGNYHLISRKDLTSELNRQFQCDFKVSQLVAFVKNHKIVSGRTGRFEQGSVSWNKGTKGLTSRNRTTFSAGSVPLNRKPIGSERICSKDGFILVKIAEPNPYTSAQTRYKHKHIWLWEQTYGPVPEGCCVAFRDANKLNCDLDNLMLVTRAELLRLNQLGYKEMPDELKPTVLMLSKVEVKRFSLRDRKCGQDS